MIDTPPNEYSDCIVSDLGCLGLLMEGLMRSDPVGLGAGLEEVGRECKVS